MRKIDPNVDTKFCPRCKRDLLLRDFVGPRGTVPMPYCVPCTKEANHDREFTRRCLESGDYPIPSCCQCCKRPFGPTRGETPCFDHDHVTNTFRGWLCYHCNLALGHMRDDINTALQMVDYLREHQRKISDQETLWKLQGIDEAGAFANRLLLELRKKKEKP